MKFFSLKKKSTIYHHHFLFAIFPKQKIERKKEEKKKRSLIGIILGKNFLDWFLERTKNKLEGSCNFRKKTAFSIFFLMNSTNFFLIYCSIEYINELLYFQWQNYIFFIHYLLGVFLFSFSNNKKWEKENFPLNEMT